MTLKRWNGAVWTDITDINRWDGASQLDLTLLKRFDGAGWVSIALPGGGGSVLAASANASSLYGSEYRLQPPTAPAVLSVGTDTPASVTVTALGGTGPYTYAWSHVSGDSAVQVLSPTSATTSFIANIGKNQSKSAVKRCTVRDSLGATAIVDVSVLLEYIVDS